MRERLFLKKRSFGLYNLAEFEIEEVEEEGR